MIETETTKIVTTVIDILIGDAYKEKFSDFFIARLLQNLGHLFFSKKLMGFTFLDTLKANWAIGVFTMKANKKARK